jgi:hypothetical protein
LKKKWNLLLLDREEEYCDLASVYFRARRRKQWASCHAPDDLLLRSSVGAAVAGQSPAGHRKQTAAAAAAAAAADLFLFSSFSFRDI